MTYKSITELTNDMTFVGRVTACCTEQADVFRDDQRQPFKVLAEDLLRGGGGTTLAFVRVVGASPGLADKAHDDAGEMDQARVTDADILASVQGHWGVIADLYFQILTGV